MWTRKLVIHLIYKQKQFPHVLLPCNIQDTSWNIQDNPVYSKTYPGIFGMATLNLKNQLPFCFTSKKNNTHTSVMFLDFWRRARLQKIKKSYFNNILDISGYILEYPGWSCLFRDISRILQDNFSKKIDKNCPVISRIYPEINRIILDISGYIPEYTGYIPWTYYFDHVGDRVYMCGSLNLKCSTGRGRFKLSPTACTFFPECRFPISAHPSKYI